MTWGVVLVYRLSSAAINKYCRTIVHVFSWQALHFEEIQRNFHTILKAVIKTDKR